jgi:hypothetical protein
VSDDEHDIIPALVEAAKANIVHDETPPEARVGLLVRATHPYSYRSGQWAVIVTVVPARGRDCWLVEFDDGATDVWVCDDPSAGFEFRERAS